MPAQYCIIIIKNTFLFLIIMTSFDLDQYIAGYSGLTKLKRLQFIAEMDSKELHGKAISKLITLLKAGQNTTLYKEVIEKYGKE